jgi:excisionase family DNA binding protein
MPATRNKGDTTKATTSMPAAANGTSTEVLTLAEAAAYLRLPEEDLLRLVREQGLPGRRIGLEWRFLKTALQEWLSIPMPPLNPQEQLMQWAGAFRDDPDLKAIVAEAYRQRGRPIGEEGE